MKCPWCDDNGMDHDTGEPCVICAGGGTISDDWTDAERKYREYRERQLAALAADMEARIVPSPAIDEAVLDRHDRMAEQSEKRKDVPR